MKEQQEEMERAKNSRMCDLLHDGYTKRGLERIKMPPGNIARSIFTFRAVLQEEAGEKNRFCHPALCGQENRDKTFHPIFIAGSSTNFDY